MSAVLAKIEWDGEGVAGGTSANLVSELHRILSIEDTELDYGYAKLALDRLIELADSTAATMATLDRMEQDARCLAEPSPTPDMLFAALRRLIYEAGPWNDHRSFAYDHDDPLGQRIGNKLLATYLATRRGNCVSMPALFLILADKLGLDVALSTAPLHVFVRYRSGSGQVLNLETTSGAHPARDEWYRRHMPMTDRAITSGLYMRRLPKREGVALLATTLLEHLMEQRRLDEALAVSEVILRHAPRDGYTMVKQGSVFGELIENEFTGKYRIPALIPAPLRPRYLRLIHRNRAAFQAAEALGWEPTA